MIQVVYTKQDGSKVTVTPMPSAGGLFSDPTVPNSPAQNCCLVRSAQALRSLGINLSIPALTEAEITAAVAAQLADKANWPEAITVSDAEVIARRDAIRGFTDAELEAHIEASKVFVKDEAGNDTEVIESVLTEAEAVAELIKKEFSITSMQLSPVTVPNNAAITATLTAEKEEAQATANVQALIASGHLVTDLAAPAYTAWKAQFTVVEV